MQKRVIRVAAIYMGVDRPPYKRLNAAGYRVRRGDSISCDLVMSKVTKRDLGGGTLFHNVDYNGLRNKVSSSLERRKSARKNMALC